MRHHTLRSPFRRAGILAYAASAVASCGTTVVVCSQSTCLAFLQVSGTLCMANGMPTNASQSPIPLRLVGLCLQGRRRCSYLLPHFPPPALFSVAQHKRRPTSMAAALLACQCQSALRWPQQGFSRPCAAGPSGSNASDKGLLAPQQACPRSSRWSKRP